MNGELIVLGMLQLLHIICTDARKREVIEDLSLGVGIISGIMCGVATVAKEKIYSVGWRMSKGS